MREKRTMVEVTRRVFCYAKYSMNQGGNMSNSQGLVFVLWGEQFEEATATIFVTEMREAGLRVKVVGLTPPHIRGSHGLALVPDLTLDQALALAARAICLVIPYTMHTGQRLKNDPRLYEFFGQAAANRAWFVISQSNKLDITNLGLFSEQNVDQLLIYPDTTGIVDFARNLARKISCT